MTRRSRDRVDLVLHGREWLACLTQDNARSTRLARELQHDPSAKHRLFPADDWSRPRTAYRDAAAAGRRSAGRCEDDIDHLGYAGGPTQNKTRSQPANVLIINDEPYLIDAGNGVARQLA